jgi:hypothetical protein
MTNQHPITPPPDLVKELQDLGNLDAITLAYQAGADQELEACCEWLENQPQWMEDLHAARRPKPPSLKQQALDQLREVNAMLQFQTTGGETSAIRRALEALPND